MYELGRHILGWVCHVECCCSGCSLVFSFEEETVMFTCQKCGFESEVEGEAKKHWDENPTHFVDER